VVREGDCRRQAEPGALYLLGTIQQEQGQAKAQQSLLRALYLDPGFVLAHFALGKRRIIAGPAAQAKRHFTQHPRHAATATRAAASRRVGGPDRGSG